MMYKIRPYVNIKTLLTIYYSLIFSQISYAIEVWGSAGESQLNRVLLLQKRVVRLILYKDKRQSDYSLPSSEPLFKHLKIMTIHNIFKLRILNFVFKSLTKQCPTQFHTWFLQSSRIHNHNTRSSDNNNLFIPQIRTTFYGKKSIKYMGPKIWNELPNTIKLIATNNTFVSKLKLHLTQ